MNKSEEIKIIVKEGYTNIVSPSGGCGSCSCNSNRITQRQLENPHFILFWIDFT